MKRRFRQWGSRAVHWLERMWVRVRYVFGYALFATMIVMAIRHTPPEAWRIDAKWFAAAMICAVLMFLLQHAQTLLFLRRMNCRQEYLFPALFTARRSVLNTLLPVRAGTVVVLPMLSGRYNLKWSDFVIYMLVATLGSLAISVTGACWLLAGTTGLLASALAYLLILVLLVRQRAPWFFVDLPELTLLALGIFATIACGIYCVLRGLGYPLSLREIITLAVLLNALAIISITPANVGIRELLLASVAPMMALPLGVAALAGAIYFVARTLSYAMILLILEVAWKHADRPR